MNYQRSIYSKADVRAMYPKAAAQTRITELGAKKWAIVDRATGRVLTRSAYHNTPAAAWKDAAIAVKHGGT